MTYKNEFEILHQLVSETGDLLRDKGLLELHEQQPVRSMILLMTEVAELGQAYKRKGVGGRLDMMREAADIIIRAMNWWLIMNEEFTYYDAESIKNYAISYHASAEKFNWNVWDYCLLMSRLAIESFSKPASIKLIAAGVVFLDREIKASWIQAVKEVLAANWLRPRKFNTVEEEKA